jgi:tetratricopeptide (TPR) repeat protein
MRNIFFLVLLFPFILGCKGNKESAEFFKRGIFHYKNNELDKAEHFFNEAIKKDEKFADAYNNRGVVYLKTFKTENAIKDFEKAVSLDNTFIDAKLNLAKVYSEIGKTGEAEKLFIDIEPKMKTSSDFYNQFGQNFVRQNHFEEGESNLKISLKINPKNVETLTNLGYIKLISNDVDEAEGLFLKALEIKPDFAYANNNQAVVLAKKRLFSEALILLEKAENKEINNIIYTNNIALCALENGNVALGLEKIKKAEKIEETNPYTVRNQGIYLLKMNKFEEALLKFSAVEKNNPEVEYIYYYLGKTYWALKNKPKACEYFKLGVKLNDYWSIDYVGNCN